MAITVALLTALGGMTLFLNNQTWTKLDRITALFLHERDLMNTQIRTIDEKANCIEKEHLKDMRTIEQKMNGNGGSK
jgi:hypothetical protein